MKNFMVVLMFLLMSGVLIAQDTKESDLRSVLKKQVYDNSLLADPVWDALEQDMYKSIFKHNIYAHNIANASTPGFKPLLDEFGSDGKLLESKEDMDLVKEMSKMNANNGRFTDSSTLLNERIKLLRSVIQAR